MNKKMIICLVFIGACLVLMLFNKKTRSGTFWKNLLKVFYNNTNNKISIYDILSFFAFPIAIAAAIVIGFEYHFSNEVSNTLLTIFSILFSLLFGILSILTATLNSKNELKRTISEEAFTAVTFSMLTSLVSLIVMIIYIILLENIDNIKFVHLFRVLTAVVISIALNMCMIFLLVIKRSYVTSISKNE